MEQGKPRIISIIYDIDVNKTVNIQSYIEKSIDCPDYSMVFQDKKIYVHLKNPIENVADIESELNSMFIDWYYQYDLEFGKDSIRFYKKGYTYEELDPNVKHLSGNIYCKSTVTCEGYATRNLKEFPISHANFKTNKRLKDAIERYLRVLQGKDLLLHFGYFYLTILEDDFGDKIHETKKRRAVIAEKLNIETSILDQLGSWTSEKGDEFTARKAKDNPLIGLSQTEEAWIHRCIRMLIIRHGEYLCDSKNLKIINLVDI